MHGDEGDERESGQEMQRAGRLPTTEQIEQPGGDRIEARRHGKPRPDHQRQQYEDYGDIGEFLQRIIVACLGPLGKAQPGVTDDLVTEMRRLQFFGRRQQIAAEMPAGETISEIDEAVDDEQPGNEEMPAPARCQILIARQGQPVRKTAHCSLAVDIRNPENARRIKAQSAQVRHALQRITFLFRLHRNEGRIVVGAILAPIERRMGVEYLQAAIQQHRHAQHVHPVRQTHQ